MSTGLPGEIRERQGLAFTYWMKMEMSFLKGCDFWVE